MLLISECLDLKTRFDSQIPKPVAWDLTSCIHGSQSAGELRIMARLTCAIVAPFRTSRCSKYLNRTYRYSQVSVSQRTYGHYRTPQRTCRCSQDSVSQRTYGHYRTPQRTCRCSQDSVSQRTYGHYRTPQRTCRCSQGFSVSANVWTLPNTSTDV